MQVESSEKSSLFLAIGVSGCVPRLWRKLPGRCGLIESWEQEGAFSGAVVVWVKRTFEVMDDALAITDGNAAQRDFAKGASQRRRSGFLFGARNR